MRIGIAATACFFSLLLDAAEAALQCKEFDGEAKQLVRASMPVRRK